ncbi:DUF4248 domain-containing protein [Parabacteroides johnsonii]|uniref:DUF4248 domain-containing protein n=1 Tax=Parabacteroides johnsonii CL02T12C29 TaxID=999419 RepID=K5Z832_9BACT|nr:DUF4248 domain-containing protein [Parabacteroides johnsonii]EKN07546.1 hypothetical protein HMPREF1077_02658 [Parabacteroides johnsonii CL02T12C29]
MQEATFRIRPYSKRELASLYFPETPTIDSTVSNLRLWIKRNGEVSEKLRETGYRTHSKIFTLRQVRILVEIFGEP